MNLKKGDKGIKVTYLQYGLHILCCSPGSFDGDFGGATENAVKKYQESYGLAVDGEVGEATWNSICGETKPIQRALSMKGYYHSSIDGVAGEETYNSVVEFQRENGLSADGQVGPITRVILLREGSVEIEEADFPLKKGDRGSKVKFLQYGLRILCCSPGTIDGMFGEGTYGAVVKFQQKYDLSADGIVGSGTWGKMETLIREIQQALVSRGYSIGVVDGVAGPGTYEGIQQFQEDEGLSVDGQVGPATREKLLGSASDGGNDEFPLKKGSNGPYVLFLQRGLRMMVINPNGVDGSYGTGTEDAVKRFQERCGLSVDGIVGTATWERLRILIKPIQQALVNHGYDTGGVDGIAGDMTYTAIMDFQEANGLSPDGMVGTATQQKLGITVGAGNESGTTSATLKKGSNGSLTRYLQRILSELGYSVTIDGIFGNDMEAAVKAFQQKYGLTADGIVGSGTWNKIFSVYKVNSPGSGVTKFVNVAKHELAWGFQEDNSNNITPYGQWYGMQGNAWCAMFVSWCAYQAGILNTTVPKYAYCPSGVEWYRNRNRFKSRDGSYIPKVGDVVFFWGTQAGRVSHTGIVIGVTNSKIQTVEGNTRDGVGTHYYDRTDTYIHGYGDNENDDSLIKPEGPSEEEVWKARLLKVIKLLEIFSLKTKDNINEKCVEIVDYFSKQVKLKFDADKEVVVSISPEVEVGMKIGAEVDLYTNQNAQFKYSVRKGEFQSNILDKIKELKQMIEAYDAGYLEYLDWVEKLSVQLYAGNVKVSFALDGGVTIYYTAETSFEINDVTTDKISFTFRLSYKPHFESQDKEVAYNESLGYIESLIRKGGNIIEVQLEELTKAIKDLFPNESLSVVIVFIFLLVILSRVFAL